MIKGTMSFKIHNGYRIHCDIARLYDRLLIVAPEFQRVALEQARKYIATEATIAFDDNCAATSSLGLPKQFDALEYAFDKLTTHFEQAKYGRSAIDFNSSLSLFPLTGSVLVMTHITSNAQLSLFVSLRWPPRDQKFEDFSYWDNTDKPDHLTTEEFDLREKLWRFVLGDTMIPSRRCLSFQLSNNNQTQIDLFDNLEKIEEFIPSFEDRLSRLVEKYTFELYSDGGVKIDFSDWLVTEEGRSIYNKAYEYASQAIRRNINLDNLRNFIL